MDQIKEWLFKDNEEFNRISVHYYQLQKTTELKGVANDLKNAFIWCLNREEKIRKYLKKVMPLYCNKAYLAVEALAKII